MRIRQVKPSFWQDAKIAALSHPARLFYIGLWGLADDAGWLRWDIGQIGVELYGYGPRRGREVRIARMTAQIQEQLPGKLEIHDCGHAQLPALPTHQHLAATTRRVVMIEKEHDNCSPAETREDPRKPALVGEVSSSNGSSSDGYVGVGGAGGDSHTLERPGIERLRLRLADPSLSEGERKTIEAALAAALESPLALRAVG